MPAVVVELGEDLAKLCLSCAIGCRRPRQLKNSAVIARRGRRLGKARRYLFALAVVTETESPAPLTGCREWGSAGKRRRPSQSTVSWIFFVGSRLR